MLVLGSRTGRGTVTVPCVPVHAATSVQCEHMVSSVLCTAHAVLDRVVHEAEVCREVLAYYALVYTLRYYDVIRKPRTSETQSKE